MATSRRRRTSRPPASRRRPTIRPAGRVEVGSYGRVARGLHWLIAGLAVIVVSFGLAIPGAPRETGSRELLMLLHRSVGLVILALMLFRAVWRAGHPPPPLPHGFPRLEAFAAQVDHALLYLMFLIMPLSGYLNAAAVGHPVSFFGLVAIPPLPMENERLAQLAIAAHLAGQFVVYALVAAHVGATLVHRLLGRHAILERMLPRRRIAPTGRP